MLETTRCPRRQDGGRREDGQQRCGNDDSVAWRNLHRYGRDEDGEDEKHGVGAAARLAARWRRRGVVHRLLGNDSFCCQLVGDSAAYRSRYQLERRWVAEVGPTFSRSRWPFFNLSWMRGVKMNMSKRCCYILRVGGQRTLRETNDARHTASVIASA